MMLRNYYVEFKKDGKKTIQESHAIPSQIDSTNDVSLRFIEAGNNLNDIERGDQPAKGKWQIFLPYYDIDHAWRNVKNAISEGKLREAKVTTKNNEHTDHALFIYAYNSNDLNEVSNLYHTIVELGLVHEYMLITFKSDLQTLNNQYGKDAYLYTSEQIKQKDVIAELTTYANNRDNEAGFAAFFRNMSRLDAQVKVTACNKLKRYVEGDKQIHFTPIDLDALCEENSTLHGLVTKCKKVNLSLPKCIDNYSAEKEKRKVITSFYSKQY